MRAAGVARFYHAVKNKLTRGQPNSCASSAAPSLFAIARSIRMQAATHQAVTKVLPFSNVTLRRTRPLSIGIAVRQLTLLIHETLTIMRLKRTYSPAFKRRSHAVPCCSTHRTPATPQFCVPKSSIAHHESRPRYKNHGFPRAALQLRGALHVPPNKARCMQVRPNQVQHR